jgi:hypothetical protein
MSLFATPASTDGIAVYVTAYPDTEMTTLSKNPNGFLVDNIQIGRRTTAGGFWGFGIYLDGSNNPGPGAPGLRAVTIRNTNVSFAMTYAYYLHTAHGTRMSDVDAYIGDFRIGIDGGSQNTTITSNTCSVTLLSGSNVRMNGVIVG